ncbi:MAG: dihydroneopterin aldolase [Sphingobacteriaceae bacterium]|nr:dihydroneopterin aldolase [Sphingobacteriaceae bacterium]
MYTQTVALHDVKCFAYHGFYAEEQLTGTYFLVNLSVDFVPNGDSEDLQNTVNYEVLNQIILTEMRHTQKLLETVVNRIMKQVLTQYSFLIAASVAIKKMHPPMEGEIKNSFVQLNYKTTT